MEGISRLHSRVDLVPGNRGIEALEITPGHENMHIIVVNGMQKNANRKGLDTVHRLMYTEFHL